MVPPGPGDTSAPGRCLQVSMADGTPDLEHLWRGEQPGGGEFSEVLGWNFWR
jgi:hypothetical protein